MNCEVCEKPATSKGLCNSHARMLWRLENPEKYLAHCRDKDKQREQYHRHRENKLRLAKKYRENLDPVAQAEYMRNYYEANAPVIKARSSQWRKNNPELRSAQRKRYRASKAGAPVNDLTPEQWESIKAAFGGLCAYCNEECATPEQDHIEPLSTGGSHTASNVVPACRRCNSRKHTTPADEFLSRLEAEASAIHQSH